MTGNTVTKSSPNQFMRQKTSKGMLTESEEGEDDKGKVLYAEGVEIGRRGEVVGSKAVNGTGWGDTTCEIAVYM